MKEVNMKKFVGLLALLSFIVVVFAMSASADSDQLPEVVFLGEGPGTFQTDLDGFVVKRFGPFRFDLEPGPTYQAASGERVWEESGANAAPPAIWEEEISLGQVQVGCIVNYIGVDDDIDGRRNAFFVNDTQVELISEGMVFSGQFTIQQDGELILVAEDSVGGWIDVCEEMETPTATPTDTATPSPTPTSTEPATPGPSPTSTEPATPGPSPTSTEPATPGPSPTSTEPATPGPSPTAQGTPEVTASPTAPPPPTATKRPRENSCVRINFEVSGDEAVRGLYIVQETGGKLLASWYALDGWQDSGWFKDIDISFENVYVRVLYYPGPDTTPTQMTILNHAPDSEDGWMSFGMCHALEVAWPN
jgi:hypothetical protein